MMDLLHRYAGIIILLLFLTKQLVVSKHVVKNGSKPGKDCYEGMCWCLQDMADCSGNGGRLQFVPVLPPIITSLNFSFNNLPHLSSDFFSNVTHLSFIDLTGNGLVSIDQHALRGLDNLTNITLDNNFLDFNSLRPVFNVSTLIQLQMRNIRNITFIPENIFIEFPLPNLQQLVLAGSNLGVLYLSDFKPLKNLTYLDVGNSRIHTLYPDTLLTLRFLILNANRIEGDFITTCSDNNTSFFPKLGYLSLRSNGISSIDKSVCLPNLNILCLEYNKLRFLHEGMFAKFPKLHLLKLIKMHTFIAGIDPGAFTNPSLEILYMSDNNIYFSHDTISSKMFAGCPRLFLLQLDHNNFTDVTDAKFQELFQDNPILRIVYLGYNKIENVTNSTFKGLSHVKELHLYSNAIEDLPDGVFDHLVNLTILRLDDNRLSEIRETTFSVSTRQRLRQLDLSGNPYACTCSLRWFRSWLIDDRRKFANFPKGYVCATVSSSSSEQVGKTQRNVTRYVGESADNLKLNSNNFGRLQWLLGSSSFQELSDSHQSDFLLSDSNYYVRRNLDGYVSLPTAYGEVYLSDFVLSDQACLLSQSTSLLTAVLAAVLVVFMLTFLVLYKYRWHIRLALYEAFRGNPQRQQQRQPEREYEYDVFVSYANEDVDWVRQELIPTLEGRHGLRLCIHQRDFPVGGNIIDNISTSVHASKRVLFVLSPHFARSRWCQFELVFCQNYVMERDDVLVLTLLAPISGRDMTDAISAMFKTTTYLAWGEEDDARNAFWGRLVLAFHDIVPR